MIEAASKFPEKWLDVRVASEYLQLPSTQVLYGMVRRRQVPFNRMGRYLRFDKLALDQWLAESAFAPRGSHGSQAAKRKDSLRGAGAS